MLTYYCRHFPVVELNFTFYRLPTPDMLARLADQTPAGFQFLVKVPRTLSHEEDHRDVTTFRGAIEELAKRDRLLGLLCQLPQATHNLPAHRKWIEHLAEELGGTRLAIEFRHRSWGNPEIPAWLAERQADLVSVDVPDLPGLFPRGLVASTPRIYVRFHSRNAENWYRSDKDRYDYDYDDAALIEWVKAIRGAGHPMERVMLLFNNCQRSQAAANAQRMRELLRQMVPESEVVEPFASPEAQSQQRMLFD